MQRLGVVVAIIWLVALVVAYIAVPSVRHLNWASVWTIAFVLMPYNAADNITSHLLRKRIQRGIGRWLYLVAEFLAFIILFLFYLVAIQPKDFTSYENVFEFIAGAIIGQRLALGQIGTVAVPVIIAYGLLNHALLPFISGSIVLLMWFTYCLCSRTGSIWSRLRKFGLVRDDESVLWQPEQDIPLRADIESALGTTTAQGNTADELVDVVLDSAEPFKIAAIWALRQMTGLGLKSAKDIVDTVPQTLMRGASRAKAEFVKSKLEAAGARVTIEQHLSP